MAEVDKVEKFYVSKLEVLEKELRTQIRDSEAYCAFGGSTHSRTGSGVTREDSDSAMGRLTAISPPERAASGQW